MKAALAALSVVLLAAAVLSQSQTGSSDTFVSCCLDRISARISLRRIQSFTFTNERCPIPAVIFILKSGLQICADPQAPWVQFSILEISRRTANSPLPPSE